MTSRYQQLIGFYLIGMLVLILSLGACTATPIHPPDISGTGELPGI